MSGIYIHIPFCKQACSYCDFHFSTKMTYQDRMITAICEEIALRKDLFSSETVQTIYFGGGTPSLLSVAQIEQCIVTIQKHFKIAQKPEITLEANPDDLTKNKIQQLAQSSINRLSIGIQSFFDEDLKLMQRAHNGSEAIACLEEATHFFDNISIDLIYGIPKMNNKRWMDNIQRALQFNLPHISSYALTVEPNTALKKYIEKGVVPKINDEQAQEQFLLLVTALEQSGYVNYEISNFGKPGYFSANNVAYWQGKKYLGVGPSAHSFDGEYRSWNVRNNQQYMKAIEAKQLPLEQEELTTKDRYNEYVMTGLRTIWGVSVAKTTTDFGATYADYLMQNSQKYISSGLLKMNNDTLVSTQKGKFLIDGIASDLFMLNLK